MCHPLAVKRSLPYSPVVSHSQYRAQGIEFWVMGQFTGSGLENASVPFKDHRWECILSSSHELRAGRGPRGQLETLPRAVSDCRESWIEMVSLRFVQRSLWLCPGQGARSLPSPMDRGEDLPKVSVAFTSQLTRRDDIYGVHF